MNNCPDLIKSIRRGYEAHDTRLSPLALFGWALSVLDPTRREWDEEAIHVSDYGYALDPSEGGCDRQLWHRLNGDDRRENSFSEEMMFLHGKMLQVIYTWLLSHGLPEGWEIKEIEADISAGLPRSDTGSCDLIIGNGDTIVGIEMKTQRGRAMQYGDLPKESHRMQAMGELYALTNLYPDKEVLQRILYIDREGQNTMQVSPVRLDKDRVERAAMHVAGIYVLEETPDPKDPEVQVSVNKTKGNALYLKEGWVCDYCSYRGRSCPGALPDGLKEYSIVAYGDHEGEYELNVDDDRVREHIDRAVSAGNVKSK